MSNDYKPPHTCAIERHPGHVVNIRFMFNNDVDADKLFARLNERSKSGQLDIKIILEQIVIQ